MAASAMEIVSAARTAILAASAFPAPSSLDTLVLQLIREKRKRYYVSNYFRFTMVESEVSSKEI